MDSPEIDDIIEVLAWLDEEDDLEYTVCMAQIDIALAAALLLERYLCQN